MRLAAVGIWVCGVLAAGCGGGGPVTAKAEVTGNIGGVPLASPNTIMFELTGGNGRVGTIYVLITEVDGSCEALKANQGFKSKGSVVLWLKNGKGDTLNPGTFGVIPDEFPNTQQNYSQGFVSRTDAACAETIESSARPFSAGSVSLSDYAPGTSATGTFSVTVGAQTISGSFAANACAGVTQAMLDAADTCP